MAKYEDLTGRRFGKLTVIRRAEKGEVEKPKKGCNVYWFCRCDCGGEKYVPTASLKKGGTQSCGCIPKDAAVKHREMSNKNEIAQAEKVRQYLCKKHGRKCFTSPAGKCPMAEHYCYEYTCIGDMYRNFRGTAREAVKQTIHEVIKADKLKEKGVL